MKKTIKIPSKILIEDYINTPKPMLCKLLLAKVENHHKPYAGIIIPTSVASPMNYPLESWDIIQNSLDLLSISVNEVDFYLDFKESNMSSESFMPVSFKVSADGELLKDTYEANLRVDEIPSPIAKIRNEYYEPTTKK